MFLYLVYCEEHKPPGWNPGYVTDEAVAVVMEAYSCEKAAEEQTAEQQSEDARMAACNTQSGDEQQPEPQEQPGPASKWAPMIRFGTVLSAQLGAVLTMYFTIVGLVHLYNIIEASFHHNPYS